MGKELTKTDRLWEGILLGVWDKKEFTEKIEELMDGFVHDYFKYESDWYKECIKEAFKKYIKTTN